MALPTAEVIQILEDGYLMSDCCVPDDRALKVFKLKHNGLNRILNTGDRLQMKAINRWNLQRYENRAEEIKRTCL